MQPPFKVERLGFLLFANIELGGPSMFESPWRVLHVLANHKKRVAQHLAARSLEHYLPLYSEAASGQAAKAGCPVPLPAVYGFGADSPMRTMNWRTPSTAQATER